jgi:hypothetical protein
MRVKSTEFFRNIKKLPPRDHSDFQQLVDWEIEKCLGGVTINGVHIPPWLYFHLNHWWIRVDKHDNFGNIVKVPALPDLRDNEWIRGTTLEQCRVLKKGYMEIGLRQGGKSEFEASVTGYNALMFENTQNVIVGGNEADLTLLKDKIDFGLKSMWEGLAIPRIDKDWRKPMVKLGWKSRGNEDNIWSYLIIRNAEDGNNTEAAAGTTAKSFVMDEVGKYLFGQVFEAAKPAFLSEFGWRTIPILVGTGGSFDNGADAERFFENPDANNFLAIVDPETGKKTCLFMSGLYIQNCKYETSLAEYLIKEGKLSGVPTDYPDLNNIPMKVSDKEKALEYIEGLRREKAKDPDKTEYLKVVMYHPLTIEECFLSQGNNIFNARLAKAQQTRLRDIGLTGKYVELFHDGEKIRHKLSNKLPISSFPVKTNESKDTPIVIYEFPIEDNPPWGLYVAGVDSYKEGNADLSSSLGAIYIYKRMHEINSEKYQDMFVASYVGRPEDKDIWQEQARLLIKYYNARTLVESDEYSFIDYMKAKGDAHYLETQPEWIKQIAPTTTVRRDYGISRTHESVRNYLHSTLKRYTEQVIHKTFDEKGSLIKETLGMTRILDPMLLEEIIKYNDDGNFDRVVAAELAIALAQKMDPLFGPVNSTQVDPRIQSLSKPREKTTLFPKGNGIFGTKRKSKLFK